MAITVKDVLKVIDIDYKDVSNDTHGFLSCYPGYKDQILREDMFNIGMAVEETSSISVDTPQRKRLVIKELKQLTALANKHEAAYVRFIKQC